MFGQRALVAPGRDTNNVLCTLVTNHQCEMKVRKWEIGEAGAKTTILLEKGALLNLIAIYFCKYLILSMISVFFPHQCNFTVTC